MTPEQATQWVEQKTAEFAARRTAPVPSREQVQDAHTAEMHLAALLADPNFARRYSEGGIAERREISELQEIIAAGADETGMSIRVGDAEVVEGPYGIRRHELFGALSDLKKAGIPEEGLERILDGNFSDEDVEFAERELDRLKNDPVWQKALLSGDRTARHEQLAWSGIIGSRKVL
jgi:hypothetical protein